MHHFATQDGQVTRETTRRASNDAYTCEGSCAKKGSYAAIMEQVRNPGRMQTEVGGRHRGMSDRTSGCLQERSWADIARGTPVGCTEGQTRFARTTVLVASAGGHARDISGGPPGAASEARADGASGKGWVQKGVTKVADTLASVFNYGQNEREERKHRPEAFLAWVSAPCFSFSARFSRIRPVTVIQPAVQIRVGRESVGNDEYQSVY